MTTTAARPIPQAPLRQFFAIDVYLLAPTTRSGQWSSSKRRRYAEKHRSWGDVPKLGVRLGDLGAEA